MHAVLCTKYENDMDNSKLYITVIKDPLEETTNEQRPFWTVSKADITHRFYCTSKGRKIVGQIFTQTVEPIMMV